MVHLAKGSTGTHVIYPEYFNNQISRSSGRRVPKVDGGPGPQGPEDVPGYAKSWVCHRY
ncbi:MAG: signal recognition particle subunit SRP19/SEC65 family protein [Candidatus Moduliflexus flocculans]|nr:signal recognition particle subunit SRP19/SEC65 family protein [Candidatus Moduliflexus flocculans]